MKQKIITIVLSLVAIVVPLLIIPDKNNINYNILRLIILLSSGITLLIILITEWKNIKLDKKDKTILCFMGLLFISTLLSGNIKKSIIGERNRYEGFFMFLTYVCIYLCSKKYFKYEKINIFFNLVFYSSLIIGILGILQKYVYYYKLYPIFGKEICSTFGNPNFFGSYISMALPITICLFIFKGNKKSFLLSIIMFFDMMASGTRSSWVAFAFIVIFGLVYLIKQKDKKYLKNIVILLLCFSIIFIYLFYGSEFIIENVKKIRNIKTNQETIEANSNKLEKIAVNSNNGQSEKINITKIKANLFKEEIKQIRDKGLSYQMGSGRIEIWRMTLKLIMQKPIFGCGPDNLLEGLSQNCTNEFVQFVKRTETTVDKAHNEYLQIAATIGIPALICYLTFLALILLPKVKLALNNQVYYIILLTIICYLIQAFFNISTIGVAPLFWMILGLSDNKEFIEEIQKEYNKK